MSSQHFEQIQRMIEELEACGYVDITESVKTYYEPYLYLCTLKQPTAEGEPIYCETPEKILSLLEKAKPDKYLRIQIWFCEECQTVSLIRYRPGSGTTEVLEDLTRSHRKLSSHCNNGAYFLRVVAPNLAPDTVRGDQTIPVWAKDRIVALLPTSNT